MDITSYILGKKAGGGGVILQEKSVGITSNGTTDILPDENYDGMTKVSVTTNVLPNLESKSINITSNGTTTVTPTDGKDGLSSVEINVEVSSKVILPDITGLTGYDSNYLIFKYSDPNYKDYYIYGLMFAKYCDFSVSRVRQQANANAGPHNFYEISPWLQSGTSYYNKLYYCKEGDAEWTSAGQGQDSSTIANSAGFPFTTSQMSLEIVKTTIPNYYINGYSSSAINYDIVYYKAGYSVID